jgi:hypothetical protein
MARAENKNANLRMASLSVTPQETLWPPGEIRGRL